MKRRILFVFLALVLVVSLAAFAACKAEEEPPVVEEEAPPVVEEEEEEAPPVEPPWEWPDKLMLSAISVEDFPYGLGIAWGTPLAEETGMKVRVVCVADHATRYRYMKEGIIFTGGITMSGKENLEGEGMYATRDGGPWHTRAIYPIGNMIWGLWYWVIPA